MKKIPLLMIATAIALGIVALAGNRVAWADAVDADESGFILGQGQNSPSQASSRKGSVVPPPATFTVCSPYDVPGVYSVGGVATLRLDALIPGYCVETILWNGRFPPGRLPDSAGKILSEIVFVRIYWHGDLADEVPVEDGDISLCFALPPDKSGQIYFYDFYGPRFFHRPEQPSWVSSVSTNNDGIVCASALTSGAYALVGQ